MTELNQDEKDETLNQNEDSDEDLDFLDESEEESEEKTDDSGDPLNILNEELRKRGLNKNYKSWDDVAKSEKQRDIDFAKKGMEEKKKEETPVSNLSDNLLIKELQLKLDEPDSKYVIDDIKTEHPNKDPYEIWKSSEYYKKEAAIRAENERNKLRVQNPSGNSEENKKQNEMSEKFKKNYPPSVQKAIERQKKA